MTDIPFPHPYRVTAPGRAPRYFTTRRLAWDYSRHIPGAVTHHRHIHENGSTSPWKELETKQ